MEARVATLRGEVALVTGASSGIGEATAIELARRGARLVLAARREDELAAVAHTIKTGGGEAITVPTDVTNAQQIARLVHRAVEAFGRVDILVNNAGIGSRERLVRASSDDIIAIVATNLLGPMLLTRGVLPGMVERRHGRIISVASVAGHIAADPLYQRIRLSAPAFRQGGASRVDRPDARATTVPSVAGFLPLRQNTRVWTSKASAKPTSTNCCQRPSRNGRWRRCCGAAASSTTRACKSGNWRGSGVASR
jgi:NAD(P)-dependent dehydrogenase (short-subunit alcohol dehydrogenase family)